MDSAVEFAYDRARGYLSACPTNLGTQQYQAGGTELKITAASATAITFWADTLNASTTLSCSPVPVPPAMCVNVGATTLPLADASSIAVNDRIYINNGGTWETQTVNAVAGNTLTVSALTNAYPQGVQVGRPRRIVYSFAGGTLSKDAGDGNGLQTLATGVQSLTFTYFGTDDAPTGVLANVRRIQISTTTQSTTSAAGPSTFTINTNVRPRNL